MKTQHYVLSIFFCSVFLCSSFASNSKKINAGQVNSIVVRYDPNTLRISGNKFAIGISAVLNNGELAHTPGLLKGETKWRNYKIEVDGGRYLFGKIKIYHFEHYAKGEGLTLRIYHRKSGDLLKTQFIAFNYEVAIKLITPNSILRAPGKAIDIGVETSYDNGATKLFWPKSNYQLNQNYQYSTCGSIVSKGNLIPNFDPFSIENHSIQLTVALKKNTSIIDSMFVTLDYRANYHYSSKGDNGFSGFSGSDGVNGSEGSYGGDGNHGEPGGWGERGPDLDVYSDVYYDTIISEYLMFLYVYDYDIHRTTNYLINVDGGSITIQSQGGEGGTGGDGGDGGSGGKGRDGDWITVVEVVNDSVTQEISVQLDGGNGGDGGYGGDAAPGGNGGDGGDIYLDFELSAKPYLHLINMISTGGSGGSGGSNGRGGSGGRGGFGNPSGLCGSGGKSGSFSYSGSSGSRGRVFKNPIPELSLSAN